MYVYVCIYFFLILNVLIFQIFENGKDTGKDPFMASYPHLIDVGIMGQCVHGKTGLCAKAGIGCYQSGLLVEKPNMTVEDFRWIAEQSKGRCNQSFCRAS